MNTKNQILVPFDGSPEAEKALNHAIGIAVDGDMILILWVLQDLDSDFFANGSNTLSYEETKVKLESLVNKYKSSDITMETMIVDGNIIDEIVRVSENPNCKLIVIGYKGVTKIGRFMLGNISGEVAKRVKNPVLIVK